MQLPSTLVLLAITSTTLALTPGCANGGANGSGAPGLMGGDDPWAAVRASDPPQIAEEWGSPVRLKVSGDYWGDSVWVTPDGGSIYFMVYEGDAMTDVMINQAPKHDPDVYVSDAPFETKRKVTKLDLAHPVWGCAGPFIDDNGDFWFMSNRELETNQKVDTDIYRNEELLPFNNEEWYGNPHYCVATDELWFDRADHEIFVLRDAAKGDFAGTPELAPRPINSYADGYQESQPWLSRDGQVLYFTSTRAKKNGGPSIYRSKRQQDGGWSEPVLMVGLAKFGVGEPSLTADGSRLFFEQIYRNGDGAFTTEFFYVERGGARTAAGGPADTLDLAGFSGHGATESLETDASNGNLVWKYPFQASPFPMIHRALSVEDDHTGLRFVMRSKLATKISVTLSEQGGIRYNHVVDLDPGKRAEVTVPFAEFENQPDSPDPNDRLDLDRVESLTLIDAKAILEGGSGDNRLVLMSVELVR